MQSHGEFFIPLHGSYDNALGQHPAYVNLLSWGWEGLDYLDDDFAKPYADLRINREIASFGGYTIFGSQGRMVFPDNESMMAFLLKWG